MSNPLTSSLSDFSTPEPVYTVVAWDSLRRVCLVTNPQGDRSWLPVVNTNQGIDGSGSFSSPPSGKNWHAVVQNLNGKKVIQGFLSFGTLYGDDKQIGNSLESSGKTQDPYDSITNSTNTYRAYIAPSRITRENYRLNSFYDSIGGDWGYRGTDGNWSGTLRGGVNGSVVSPLNQILQFAEDDLIRLISRNFDLFSDWGTFQLENDNGKTRLFLRGNSGNNSNFDSTKETYQFELEIGNCKKFKADTYFLTLTFTPKGGAHPFSLTIDNNGSLQLFGSKDGWLDFHEELGLVARNFGLFAKDSVTVDGKNTVKLVAGQTASLDPDTGEITVNTDGMHLDMDSAKVKAGKIGSTKALVTEDHLVKHNKLVEAVLEISAIVGAGAAKASEAVDLVNKTVHLEGS